MKSRIYIAVLLAATFPLATVASAQSKAADNQGHGAHGAASPSAIVASIAPASGLKIGEPATFTLSLATKEGNFAQTDEKSHRSPNMSPLPEKGQGR